MTHRYPDNTLEKALRARGFRVQCNWQLKGPKNTEIAWIEHLVASHPDGSFGTMIVETFMDDGWSVYVVPTNRNDVDITIEATIKSLKPEGEIA
jgi:hypothetical protein